MNKRRATGSSDLFSASKSWKPTEDSEDRRTTFVAHLKALNSQYAKWIAQQASSQPTQVWTAGAEDYLHHSKQLLADFQDVLQAADQPAPSALGATKPSLPAFGGLSTPAATAATPLFNFGAAPVSLGTPGPTPSAAPPIEAHEEEEDVQEEPEEVQIETGDIQVLLKQRASLLVMSEAKKWEDRGRGMLTLRQPRSGGQPFLVFTTDTGRVLVNAPLVRGMKPTGNPKTPRNLVMALHNAVGGGPPAHGMYIFKAEDAEAAKALRGAILQHV
ncbi:hypothetical protein ACKKBF_B20525 [Auxenochlorella protothecoides x Auxenochlorella symbiontica]